MRPRILCATLCAALAGAALPPAALAAAPSRGAATAVAQAVRLGGRTLALGMSGPDVFHLEVLLVKRGYRVSERGSFDAHVRAAVERAQRVYRLPVDGVVGPLTLAALRAGAAPATSSGAATPQAESLIARMISAANRIARLPYRYGGGHRSFSDTAYDCSGSVSYVLNAAGLLSSPETSGELMSYGVSGPGRSVTIYSKTSHVFMVIQGQRFDTSALHSGSRWTTAPTSTAGYVVRHPSGL